LVTLVILVYKGLEFYLRKARNIQAVISSMKITLWMVTAETRRDHPKGNAVNYIVSISNT
jgi:hypothetical protein